MPPNGLWPVATISSGQPRTHILALSKDHTKASASTSVGEYQLSVGVVNMEPAKTNFQPPEQHTGVFLSEQLQYFWSNKYLILLFFETTICHSQGDSLTNLMIINMFELFQPKSHQEPHNESGSLSPAEHLVGFELGTFRF